MEIAQNNIEKNKEKILLLLDNHNFEVRKSNIHGEGLFSLQYFTKGTELDPSIIHKSGITPFKKFIGDQCNPDLKWDFSQTTATLYINHCNSPNLKLYRNEPDNGILYAKCIIDINVGDEITLDYKKTIILSEDCSDPDVIKLYCNIF